MGPGRGRGMVQGHPVKNPKPKTENRKMDNYNLNNIQSFLGSALSSTSASHTLKTDQQSHFIEFNSIKFLPKSRELLSLIL